MQFLSILDGAVRLLPGPPPALRDGELLWCDCHYDEARAWVAPVESLTGISVFENHLLDAENLLHPSYFESTQRYEMVVFRGLAFHVGAAGPESAIKIRTRPTVFFLAPGCLVTVRPPDSRLVPALRERLLRVAAARQRLPTSPEDLMLRLLNAMVDRYLDLRMPLTEQLERWQRQLLDPRRAFRDWLMLLDARAELRKLEQLCEEQLDALQEWQDERLEQDHPTAEPFGPLPDALKVRASDLVNHIHRVLNHARRLQDSIESAVQLHFSSTAYRTNEIMRTLTTITAIFMPLTLITGIFGMNFEFIPGLHSSSGFWIALGAMAGIAVLLLAFFRARRYFGTTRVRRRSRHSRARARPEDTSGATATDGAAEESGHTGPPGAAPPRAP